MIDLKITEIGGAEIGRKLADADAGIGNAIRAELALVGDEIVADASARAPKRSGILSTRIVWFFGRIRLRGRGVNRRRVVVESKSKKSPGKIEFEVRPTGRVAHLMERGVNASFHQRTGRGGKGERTRGRTAIGPFVGEAMQGPDFRYARTLQISPRPFFQPAVNGVGGASGVGSRLQSAISSMARAL